MEDEPNSYRPFPWLSAKPAIDVKLEVAAEE